MHTFHGAGWSRANIVAGGIAWLAAVAACGGGEPNDSAASTGVAGAARDGAWLLRTPSGTAVRVRLATMPPGIGATSVDLSIDPPPVADASVSIDVASPTMPMHGVTRFDAGRLSAGRYLAAITIPMEGRWALYVNVASDTDTVSVELDAAPAGPGHPGGQHHHVAAVPRR